MKYLKIICLINLEYQKKIYPINLKYPKIICPKKLKYQKYFALKTENPLIPGDLNPLISPSLKHLGVLVPSTMTAPNILNHPELKSTDSWRPKSFNFSISQASGGPCSVHYDCSKHTEPSRAKIH